MLVSWNVDGIASEFDKIDGRLFYPVRCFNWCVFLHEGAYLLFGRISRVVYERIRLIYAVDRDRHAPLDKFVQCRVIIRRYFGETRRTLILLFANDGLSVVRAGTVIRRRLSNEDSGRIDIAIYLIMYFLIGLYRAVGSNLLLLFK